MTGRITRRDFGRLAGAAALAAPFVRPARAASARIVVIGGGAGGATAAGILARSGAALDVTLVEPKPVYTTCFFSNHAIAGLRPLDSLTHNYHALAAMEDGGTFLIAPPENPYRCPTAPYERVSLVAHYLKRTKPKSRIVILDAKDSFPLQALFEEGWARFYAGMIEVIPAEFAGGVRAVDAAAAGEDWYRAITTGMFG